MKCIFLSFSHHAYAEDASPYKEFIELEGGDYLVTHQSVLHDVDHNYDSIMLVQQGVSTLQENIVAADAVHESDRIKLQEQRVGRDRMFPRRLFRGLSNLFYCMAVVVMTMAMYMLVWVFAWAWFHVWLPI